MDMRLLNEGKPPYLKFEIGEGGTFDDLPLTLYCRIVRQKGLRVVVDIRVSD